MGWYKNSKSKICFSLFVFWFWPEVEEGTDTAPVGYMCSQQPQNSAWTVWIWFESPTEDYRNGVMSVYVVGWLESPGGIFSLWNSVCSSSWKFFRPLFIWLAIETDPSISGTGLTKPGAKRFSQKWSTARRSEEQTSASAFFLVVYFSMIFGLWSFPLQTLSWAWEAIDSRFAACFSSCWTSWQTLDVPASGKKRQPCPQEAEYEVRLDNKVGQGWTLEVSLDVLNGLCAAWLLGIFLVVSFQCMDHNFGGTTLRLRGVRERKAGTPLWSRFTKTELPTSLPVSSVGL